MIEQFFQIGENWIDKEQYAFQLGDAILFLCFLIFVLYLFVFAIYSNGNHSIIIQLPRRSIVSLSCSPLIKKTKLS